VALFFQTNTIRVILIHTLTLPSFIMAVNDYRQFEELHECMGIFSMRFTMDRCTFMSFKLLQFTAIIKLGRAGHFLI